MKRKVSYLSLIILGICVALYSCKDNDKIDNDPIIDKTTAYDGITVIDGVLSFDSPELYIKTVAMLGNISQESRNEWGKKIGFVSLGTEIDNTINSIANCDDDAEIDAIMKVNADILI